MSHPTWEYHLEPAGDLSEARLNELGLRGWELVTIEPSSNQAVFKRPGPDYRERITISQRENLDLQEEGTDR
jgi:hypothetical protein